MSKLPGTASVPKAPLCTESGFVTLLGPYAILVRTLLLGLLVLGSSRALHIVWLYQRVEGTGKVAAVIGQGLRADLIMLSLLLVIPVLVSPLWAHQKGQQSWFRFTRAWGMTVLCLLLFMELATPTFILQYDIRPNRLFIEYLRYPREVLATLWGGFRWQLLLSLGLCFVLGLGLYRILAIPESALRVWPLRRHLLLWPVVLFALFVGIRSTTGHRPANPALFAITSDVLVNSLVISSAYSVLYSLYDLRHEARSSEIYGSLPEAQMLALTRDWPWLAQYHFTHPELPTLHWQQAAYLRERPLNLVIVLQESLGATFVGSLGGVPVTPELERLKRLGLWFNNLYATGTRSVRGIEAVVAGFMPTPAQSVVKLSNSQQHFSTLASILQGQGYHTQFIYGGEAHFDNMRRFFTGNGFSDIVDQAQIKDPVFVGSWGASDEDLFRTAHKQFERLHREGKPFFSLVFTSSNHEPFEYPADRIALHEQPPDTVNNAVKYADWAMGRFFDQAQASDYWQDTVFLIVADHDNRVYGNNLVPVEKFRIPGLILGADITPGVINTISSQIDLAPTLLSMIGISACHPMPGRDLALDAYSPGRALLQFNDYFALLTEQGVTILKPNGEAVAARYDVQTHALQVLAKPVPEPRRLQALAHVQLPAWLYREGKYRDDANGDAVTCADPAVLDGSKTISSLPQ